MAYTGYSGDQPSRGKGAFTSTLSGQGVGTADNRYWASISQSLDFDANANSMSYGNLMAGHAGGPDIRPYNVPMLPLIAV